MRMVDLIQKKRDGKELTNQEIHFIIDGYVKEEIPDYQMSALLMAICFNGLNERETITLTKEMMYSGNVIDLSQIVGLKADKHSTGGVGDKTSLVLGPMVAACGVPFAKMSGKGLGHTGGTLDKLESIPGFNILMSQEDFIKQVNDIKIAIIGQTNDLVPADKKMYALRDVTATVSCIPLIASSIMSKKLAAGSDTILLDVKYGKGAFMQTVEDASLLANTMIRIGNALNKNTRAMISNMNQPLGKAIGNILELKEALQTIRGDGPEDLLELCLTAGSHILVQTKNAKNESEAREKLLKTIANGSAFEKFKEMVQSQGGNVDCIEHSDLLDSSKEQIALYSDKAGYVKDIDALSLGLVSMKLGGGRETKEDTIDYTVGLILNKKVADYVEKGEVLAVVHTNTGLSKELKDQILNAYTIVDKEVDKPVLIEKILM